MRTPDLLSHERLFGTGSVVLRKARRARADRLFPAPSAQQDPHRCRPRRHLAPRAAGEM